jgi:hypothetical protein
MYKDYVPHRDLDLQVWAKTLSAYASDNFTRWQVPDPNSFLHKPLTAFETALKLTQEPDSGKVTTLLKDEARKTLVRAFRSYVQGFLAKNPMVTDADRKEMGITIHDLIPRAQTVSKVI